MLGAPSLLGLDHQLHPPVCKPFCKPGREKINARPKIALPADPHSRRLAEIRMITNTDVNTSIFSWSEETLSRPSLKATINHMNNQETRTKTIHAPNIVDDNHTSDICSNKQDSEDVTDDKAGLAVSSSKTSSYAADKLAVSSSKTSPAHT